MPHPHELEPQSVGILADAPPRALGVDTAPRVFRCRWCRAERTWTLTRPPGGGLRWADEWSPAGAACTPPH